MNKIQNIDNNIIADVATRIEKLITNAITSGENIDNSEISAMMLRRLVKLPETYPFTLSWSHYLVLMRIESDEERRFYEIEAQKQNWSARQLQRQYSSSLYGRLALSCNKDEVMRLTQKGHTISLSIFCYAKKRKTRWEH